ncbi:MAG TPA: NAD(P)H-dependent oxidoreductase [Chitinophagales bacterium]
MNVTIISGSPRKPNFSERISTFLKIELEKKYPQHTYTILDVREFSLPFVQNVWQNKEAVPAEKKALGDLVFGTDAFILVSPEYNGGYSSAMKNLLDHFPKFAHKTFGIVTYSPGMLGGIRAAQQMQNLICGLFGIPSPQMLTIPAIEKKINDEGAATDETFVKVAEGFLKEFMWLSEAVAEKK